MSKRLQEFDIIRAAAALAVIAIHITASYMNLPLAYFWNHAVRFAVPLFIIISGFLLCWTDRDDTFLPAWEFYIKRLHRILWPYIIWTCLYSLLNAYLSGLHNPIFFLITLGKNLLWGTGYYHLYFLPIILQLYLLYPLLRRWLEKDARMLLLVSLVLTLMGQMVLYLYLLHIIALPPQYSAKYVLAFPVWLFYFVFGMYAAWRKEVWETKLSSGASLVIFGIMWLVSLGLVLLDSRLTFPGSIVRPSIMLYTIGSYFFFYALALWFKQKKWPWLTWLSAQSFLLYLMHPLVLTILVYSSIKIEYPGLWAGTRGLLGLYIVTTASTIFMTYIISLTPLASLLGGIKSGPKSRRLPPE
jgi:peptidoglycan/LPS O-acetylase OafA/YrhL